MDDGAGSGAATGVFIPHEFRCPISGDLMEDPVVAEDGRSYEREMIEAWFAQCIAQGRPRTSAVVENPAGDGRMPIGAKLVANDTLKRAIDELREEIKRRQKQKVIVPGPGPGPGPEEVLPPGEPGGVGTVHELGEIFAQLDPLRELLEKCLDGWQPPALVVVGNEKSGKSSQLERLCMMPMFPHAEEICTRLPIEVRLRRGPAKAPRLQTFNTRTKRTEGRIVSVPMETAHIDVRREMDRLVAQQNAAVTGVSLDRSIILHVQSPNVPNLDLVDLPGVVAAAAAGEPDDMPEQTRALVTAQIDQHKDHSLFLCAVDATTAPNTSTAMQLLKEKRVLDKTIGVITMCDFAAAPQQKKKIRARLDQTGDAVALKPHGYVATMNAPVEGALSNLEKLEQQAMAEPGFFAAHGYQDKMDAGLASNAALLGRINGMFVTYVKETWVPMTLDKLAAERQQLVQANADLGLPPAFGRARPLDESPPGASFVVVGAGNAELNGVYYQIAEKSDGKPKWRSDAGAVLQYKRASSKGAAWWWVAPGGNSICAARSTAEVPPEDGWEDNLRNLSKPLNPVWVEHTLLSPAWLDELRPAAQDAVAEVLQKEMPWLMDKFSAHMKALKRDLERTLLRSKTLPMTSADSNVAAYLTETQEKVRDICDAANKDEKLLGWLRTALNREDSGFKLSRFPQIVTGFVDKARELLVPCRREFEELVLANTPLRDVMQDMRGGCIAQQLGINGSSVSISQDWSARPMESTVRLDVDKIIGAIFELYAPARLHILHTRLQECAADVVARALDANTEDACNAERLAVLKQIALIDQAGQGIRAIAGIEPVAVVTGAGVSPLAKVCGAYWPGTAGRSYNKRTLKQAVKVAQGGPFGGFRFGHEDPFRAGEDGIVASDNRVSHTFSYEDRTWTRTGTAIVPTQQECPKRDKIKIKWDADGSTSRFTKLDEVQIITSDLHLYRAEEPVLAHIGQWRVRDSSDQCVAPYITIDGAAGEESVMIDGREVRTPAYPKNAKKMNGEWRLRADMVNGKVAYDSARSSKLFLYWADGSWWVGPELGKASGIAYLSARVASPDLHKGGQSWYVWDGLREGDQWRKQLRARATVKDTFAVTMW